MFFITPLGLLGTIAGLWAVVIRFLRNTIGIRFGLKKLIQYDTALSTKFAEKQLSPFLEGDKYNFDGIYLPTPSNRGDMYGLLCVIKDVLGVYLLNNDNYHWKYVDKLDRKLVEGVYCYSKPEIACEISINYGDTVLDIGAWMGDFSAYACKKGATVYAFEPLPSTLVLLEKTVMYNSDSPGKIIIVPLGAGSETKTMDFMEHLHFPAPSGLITDDSTTIDTMKKISCAFVKLDDWVLANGISKIDFIKADIEGFERDMLKGATNILKQHKPKLSICTYHKQDDPEALTNIILEANPEYNIIYRSMKLFAWVPE